MTLMLTTNLNKRVEYINNLQIDQDTLKYMVHVILKNNNALLE